MKTIFYALLLLIPAQALCQYKGFKVVKDEVTGDERIISRAVKSDYLYILKKDNTYSLRLQIRHGRQNMFLDVDSVTVKAGDKTAIYPVDKSTKIRTNMGDIHVETIEVEIKDSGIIPELAGKKSGIIFRLHGKNGENDFKPGPFHYKSFTETVELYYKLKGI